MQDEDVSALSYGNEAVQRPADAALGYGDTAVENPAVKSDKSTPKVPPQQAKELIIIGNGYPKYGKISDEIDAIKQEKHHPQNDEMNRTAKDIGKNIHKVTDAGGFFRTLVKEKGPFNKVVWIGHGNESELLPSMKIQGKGTFMRITATDFDNFIKESDKKRKEIIAKLTPEAEIFLISCSFSQKEDFKKTVANFFQRCVNSFEQEVRWCIMYSKDDKKIERSGRLALETDYQLAIKNLPLGKEDLPVCTDETLWKKGLDIFKTQSKMTCPDGKAP